MASELQETLNRIIGKSEVLLAKYTSLRADKATVDKENEELKSQVAVMSKELEQLRLDNEYLKMARNISPTRETIKQNQAVLTKLVQDIDKCISQLIE